MKTKLSRAPARRWRRWLAAALLGALACLALPPFAMTALLVPVFVGLSVMLSACRGPAGAFALGWMFGFGHFAAGLYWVGTAFSVAGVAPSAAPFAVLGLAAANAVFPGLALLVSYLARARGGFAVVVLATSWTAAEWLRANLVLGGFPWNLLGYAWVDSLAMLQTAAVFGVYGLSWLTVLAAAAPSVLLSDGRAWRPLAASWGLVAAVAVAGMIRLPGEASAVVEGVTLRLVQANIVQYHKWRPERRADNLRRHLALTAAPGPEANVVIWPETATPYLLAGEPDIRERLGAALPAGGLLITGAVRGESDGEGGMRVWNSLHAIDDHGALVATYDKFHLVPFGEYMPLRGLFDLVKLSHGETDFSRGPGPVSLRLGGLPPVSPLICYEVIFPGNVRNEESPPAWLLNLTNDAWYGISTGPYQHFQQARVRAIEEGVPLVRAANTGVSGVVDSVGRIVARLDLGETGVVDSPLPVAKGDTLYVLWRDWPLLALCLFVGVMARRMRVKP
jgi:apolipoprotein N-acyltransferase